MGICRTVQINPLNVKADAAANLQILLHALCGMKRNLEVICSVAIIPDISVFIFGIPDDIAATGEIAAPRVQRVPGSRVFVIIRFAVITPGHPGIGAGMVTLIEANLTLPCGNTVKIESELENIVVLIHCGVVNVTRNINGISVPFQLEPAGSLRFAINDTSGQFILLFVFPLVQLTVHLWGIIPRNCNEFRFRLHSLDQFDLAGLTQIIVPASFIGSPADSSVL